MAKENETTTTTTPQPSGQVFEAELGSIVLPTTDSTNQFFPQVLNLNPSQSAQSQSGTEVVQVPTIPPAGEIKVAS